MAAADWEEIKRLAADFQRAQLSSTVQRLSERNCIEIVQLLQQQKLIDLIYTTDGKEFLTSQELGKEIREELQVQGGRVNLVDLQQILNVDFSHVESKVNEILKNDKSLILVLGQLIDRSYLDAIAEEINDKLQDQGQITVAELTKEYNLPGDFLAQVVWDRLGSTILGQVDDFDRNLVYTDDFVNRHRAKIRGAFSAVIRPTPLQNVMTQHNLQERLFNTILEELVSSGRLAGSVSGGTQDKAQYVPDIYTQAQNQWIDAFYKQNGYFEYDSMRRLGISDPVSFIKKRFKNESLQYLSTCCLGTGVSDMIEAEVDEALASKSWVDVTVSERGTDVRELGQCYGK
ncbi:E3 UFM1-protein ligase 1 [Lamellibrachia satsuma]|nr:E3 UFM1-protein ligase 1 [Lamellibrachia satsuma]